MCLRSDLREGYFSKSAEKRGSRWMRANGRLSGGGDGESRVRECKVVSDVLIVCCDSDFRDCCWS